MYPNKYKGIITQPMLIRRPGSVTPFDSGHIQKNLTSMPKIISFLVIFLRFWTYREKLAQNTQENIKIVGIFTQKFSICPNAHDSPHNLCCFYIFHTNFCAYAHTP